MKTKLTWRHEHRVLKIDDTGYDTFPEVGDVIEMDEAGETQRFEVAGLESAVVVLEAVPDDTTLTDRPTRAAAQARKNQRIADEQAFSAERTFRVKRTGKSAPKSKALSKTSRGNKTSRAARTSAKTVRR